MPDPMMEVPLMVGSHRYTLYFGNKARRMVERETGRRFADLREPTQSDMTVALWAALERHHPALDLSDVDDIIDEIGQVQAWQALGEAIRVSSGIPDGGGEASEGLPEGGGSGGVGGEDLVGETNGIGARTSKRRSKPGLPPNNSGD